ncbi:MAG: hypothetical protein ACU84H_00740 [Gammaproteobacteria bacterium]
MKLIFHIGLPKTGTTRIQQAAVAAHDRLAEAGIHWPNCCAYQEGEGDAIGHHKLADAMKSHNADAVLSLLQQSYKEARFRSLDTMLLSSEGFCNIDPEMFGLILRGAKFAEVIIACYLRRPADLVLSWYAQDIHGYTCSRDLVSWHASRKNYVGVLPNIARWTQSYPQLFQARFYERANFKEGDVWQDFTGHFLGVESLKLNVDSALGNFSLKGNLLIIKRAVNGVSMLHRAVKGGITASDVRQGQAQEVECLWHLFDQLAREDRFRNVSGYALAGFELDYLEAVNLKEVQALQLLDSLPVTMKQQIGQSPRSCSNLTYAPTSESLREDCNWIVEWIDSIDKVDSYYPRRVIFNNKKMIMQLFSDLY